MHGPGRERSDAISINDAEPFCNRGMVRLCNRTRGSQALAAAAANACISEQAARRAGGRDHFMSASDSYLLPLTLKKA